MVAEHYSYNISAPGIMSLQNNKHETSKFSAYYEVACGYCHSSETVYNSERRHNSEDHN
jgi:hypothetical protein